MCRFIRLNLLLLLGIITYLNVYAAAPVINSFSPSAGAVGSLVTIKGEGFNIDKTKNIVFFGGVRADVSNASSRQLTVKVPAGSAHSQIAVLNLGNNLYGYSSAYFITKYTSKSNLNQKDFDPVADFSFTQSTVTQYFIAVSDLDGDGKPDIIVSDETANGISIFRNTSTSGAINQTSFGAPFKLNINYWVGQIKVQDIDGDGMQDIVAITNTGNDLVIFRNESYPDALNASAFRLVYQMHIDRKATAIDVADLDNDGVSDLVLTNDLNETAYYSKNISIYRSTSTPGSISFQDKFEVEVGVRPWAVHINDLDGDNKKDIVVAVTIAGARETVILKNTSSPGSLTAASFQQKTKLTNSWASNSITTADIDGDGKPEIITDGMTGFMAYYNKCAKGVIDASSFAEAYTFGNERYTMVEVADMNGDGKPDIAAGCYSVEKVSLFLNTSTSSGVTNASFAGTADMTLTGLSLYGLALADVDRDGKPDIITDNIKSSKNVLSIYRSNPVIGTLPVIDSFTPLKGSYGSTVTITGTNFTGATAVAFGDVAAKSFKVNSATSITTVVGAGASGTVAVTSAGGTGKLGGFVYETLATATSFAPHNILPGTQITINGTNLTIVTAVSIGGVPAKSFKIVSPTVITAIAGQGTSGNVELTIPGTQLILPDLQYILAPVINSFSPASGPIGTKVTIKGVNFFNDIDVNIVHFGATQAKVVSATPTELVVTVPAGASYQPISVLNQDTRLAAYSKLPFLSTYPSKRDIRPEDFKSMQVMASDKNQWVFNNWNVTADLDGDGKIDVVTRVMSQIKPYLNTISGSGISVESFKPQASIYSPNVSAKLLLADLTGDGLKDLIEINDDRNIYVYKNLSSRGSINFDMPVKLTVAFGKYPGGALDVAVADVDGDGRADLVARANATDGNVSVRRNTSTVNNVAFEPEVYFQLSGGSSISLADMDGDGFADIVTGNETVQVMRNTSFIGTIRFDPAITTVSVKRFGHSSVADFDNDGKLDIVVSYSPSQADCTVDVFRNTSSTGSLSFSSALSFSKSALNYPPQIADFDGDGSIDVMVGDKILRNTSTSGTISFADAITFSESYFYQIAGDVNNDGTPDIIIGNTNDYFCVKLNLPTPLPLTVPPRVTALSSNFGPLNTNLTIDGENFDADVNNNIVYFGAVKAKVKSASVTKIEVTVPVGTTYQPVSVLNKKTSLSGFSPLPFNVTFPYKNDIYPTDFDKTAIETNDKPVETAAADIDGDGKTDLIFSTANQKYFSVLINASATGTINAQSFKSKITIDIPESSYSIVAGDINNDGKPDIIANSGVYFYIFRNTTVGGNVSFAPPISIHLNSNGLKAYIEDMDNDGRPDLVILSANNIYIVRNTSVNGNIDNTSFVVNNVIYGNAYPELWIEDIDGDGNKDILAMYPKTVFLINKSTKGNFSFDKKASDENYESFSSVVLTDLNKDGKPDMFINYPAGTGGYAFIRYNESVPGSPAFGQVQLLSIEKVFRPQVGDMNGDGRPDIVFNDNSNTLSIMYNQEKSGQVDFSKQIKITTNGSPYANTIADIDNDGVPDIVLTDLSNKTGFTVFRNNPNTNTTFTSFSPSVAAAQTTVTITGGYLNNVTGVSFGGVPAKSFTVVSPLSITAVVDAGSASGDVLLTTAAKTFTLPGFIFVPKPVITVEGSTPIPRGGSVVLKAQPVTADYTYKWRLSGNLILNATQAQYTATKGGNYSVETTYKGSISQTSDMLKIEEIFNLPTNNFEVVNYDATCRGQNNGEIIFRATKVNYNYIATITGNGFNKTVPFTSSFAEGKLAPGTYSICITIPEQPQYSQCFTSVISQPADLSVYTAVNTNNELLLSLGGSSQYYINLNGIETTTQNNQLSLPLKKGVNSLIVGTDKDCQGKISRLITTQNDDMVFPNPFKTTLYVNLGERIVKSGNIKVYNNMGGVVYATPFSNASGPFPVNLSNLMVGPYTLILEADKRQVMFKIIKE